MPDLNSKKTSPTIFRHIPTVVGVSLSIGLVTAGALALSSCATSPSGVARELSVYSFATNAVATLKSVAPALPQPVGGALEGFLALASAGLALWQTHLHRAVSALRNQAADGSTPPQPPAI